MDEQIEDGLEEHDEAKDLLDEIAEGDPTSEEWMETLDELSDSLDHHIKDEEENSSPSAARRLPTTRPRR